MLNAVICKSMREEKRKEKDNNDDYSAMATTAAPPIMARNSRCKLAVVPAESVCNPGADEAVAAGWTTVTAVTVFRSPLAMVVVLGKVDVKGVLFSVVDGLDELVVDEADVEEGEEEEEEEEEEEAEAEVEVEVEVDNVVEDAAVEVASELDATVDEVVSVEDADVDVGAVEEASAVLLLLLLGAAAAGEEEGEVGWSEVGWSEVVAAGELD